MSQKRQFSRRRLAVLLAVLVVSWLVCAAADALTPVRTVPWNLFEFISLPGNTLYAAVFRVPARGPTADIRYLLELVFSWPLSWTVALWLACAYIATIDPNRRTSEWILRVCCFVALMYVVSGILFTQVRLPYHYHVGGHPFQI
jgi:hypothetical protein